MKRKEIDPIGSGAYFPHTRWIPRFAESPSAWQPLANAAAPRCQRRLTWPLWVIAA
ncbi:MAG: hypothetical protein KGQ60_01575 [Planctomycetes bacterium]|nr:hypothetical protein [Planctomycetota bacterium]